MSRYVTSARRTDYPRSIVQQCHQPLYHCTKVVTAAQQPPEDLLRLAWLAAAETRRSSPGTCSVSDPAPTTHLPPARNETTTHLGIRPGHVLDGTLLVVSALSVDAESVDLRSSRLSNDSAFTVRPAIWRHSTKETCRSGIERVRNVKLWHFVSLLSCGSFPSLFSTLLLFEESRHCYFLFAFPLIGFCSSVLETSFLQSLL
ncbi:hypothetical protein DPSP01_013984 [Paraphaeosphaeria sporulosa]